MIAGRGLLLVLALIAWFPCHAQELEPRAYDDVVRDINRHYRKSTSGWAVGIPSITSLRRLLHSIATMSILKPKK